MHKFNQPLPDTMQETTPARPPSSAREARLRPSQNGFLTAEHHDISIAVITAMLFPGGGQLYNGQVGKGVSLMIITLAGLIFIALRVRAPALLLLGLALGLLLWLAAIIDAAIIAHRLIHRQPVRVWQWF
jgi:hypothetical protein